ncbi:GNAT family N-acetyltransferase [Cellulomonas fengjieae]|uniref:GNAT family N-acetyltransferase n=1 Tax=Cellulomonas fengjieae TaxID=2819978 RepID=A0ABS3SLE7_9CELL|nr:GNAT family N-acetyltransferase [Cellulomonas fengjieae]MBO3086309.1 GNAT family N-acetyltransferase [Cellulomonas fengjieae]QVI65652.1 GNAT family N-acetyltransferase [Cellulomonas fengjieae]
MTDPIAWLAAAPLRSARLVLEPLDLGHVDEAFDAFDDPRLHTYTGGHPASLDELRARFARQAVGSSTDGSQGWLNWMLRRQDTHELVGTVQATLSRGEDDELQAELAWVVASDHQGRGYASEAAVAVAGWLREHGVGCLIADIHPDHQASAGVARAVGLHATTTVVDGEIRWTT